ncbi:hypothetical protein LCGC14_1087330 [marine sediment metagenome]|uniref:PD-(D/E)XK endonuclease-like domain-containing protein n=1 Tax=marine sediment metagenome TaxID=412755 RepID=A0A0F9QJF5_9ZZZZ
MSVLYDERAETHGPYFNEAGRIVPSVTTVIGQNLGWDTETLYNWIARVTKEGYEFKALTSVAAEVGTCAHQLVEQHLNPELQPLDPNVWAPRVWEHARVAYEAYIEWEEFYKPELLFSELKLTHEGLQYAGTLDFGAVFQGEPALIDFKTSDSVRRKHVIQAAAYRELWKISLNERPRVIVLRLPIYGEKAHMQDITGSMDMAFEVFKVCLDLHRLKDEWEHGDNKRLGRLIGGK